MKKLCLILGAIMCAFLCAVGIDMYTKVRLNRGIDKVKYYNDIKKRNSCDYCLDKVIDDTSIVVLGSSELNSSDNIAYPPVLFNYGNSDFNMILVGAGSIQSLPQAVTLGALEDNIKNAKVVLIISPQWFTKQGLQSNAYCSRFSETNFLEFLKNQKISQKTKQAIAERINSLLKEDPSTLERVKEYEEVYLYNSKNLFKAIKTSTYGVFINAKLRLELADDLEDLSFDSRNEYVLAEEINYSELMKKAQEVGELSTVTNEYGVQDDYFEEYIEEDYSDLKDSYADSSFCESPEYNDLKLFLDVCMETGIEPMIISVPVNGRWYDYCGFPKSDRNTFYQNIREICSEYNVKLADFSDREYELYFLRDIMHIGWKGWVYLDRAIYSFYKDDDIPCEANKKEIVLQRNPTSCSHGIIVSEDNFRIVTEDGGVSLTSLKVMLPETGLIIDSADETEKRTTVFLNSSDSGIKQIRFCVQTDDRSEYIDYTANLNKETTYMLEYNVDSFSGSEICVNKVKLYEMIY